MTAFVSTRGASPRVTFSEALVQGLAPDGGLYVPEIWPKISAASLPASSLAASAAAAIAPFLRGDVLSEALDEIIAEAFDFPLPIVDLDTHLSVLELFHGPTAAFKDFGARFLAACLRRLRRSASRSLRILVATSGDTGGAVAAALHNQPGVEVVVLFPGGLVSPTQERQLTCWDGNVRTLRVAGTFDDCQRLVKRAFADAEWRSRHDLSSANSINLGRLLPQMGYLAWASLALARRRGAPISIVIPSGNLGHATGAVWARKVGLPISEIVLAHNANRTMPDFLETGVWRARATVPTLASAMDVGDPSNAERLRDLFPDLEALRAALKAYVVDDDAIKTRIADGFERLGRFWCPHTAAGMAAYARHKAGVGGAGPWLVAATAHGAKFPEIVSPIIGQRAPNPKSLSDLMSRPVRVKDIPPDLGALREALD